MCPDSERLQRESCGDLNEFEISSTSSLKLPSGQFRTVRHTSALLAVKKFRRCAAGRDIAEDAQSTVRDAETLTQTMNYLVNVVMFRELSKTLDPFQVDKLYNFLDDRFRAIRQDALCQQIFSESFVYILEIQIVIHIFALSHLIEGTSYGFNRKLCLDQISQCYSTLFATYEKVQGKNQHEFTTGFILLNINSDNLATIVINNRLPVRSMLQQQVYLLLALWKTGGYVFFASVVSQLPSIVNFFADAIVSKFYARALEALNVTFSSKEPFSIPNLQTSFQGLEDLRLICSECGLDIQNDAVTFKNSNFKNELGHVRLLNPESINKMEAVILSLR